ncbi:hypothetical protein FOMPIDRAFT_1024268, partial [Fomitopsis schrenkii]
GGTHISKQRSSGSTVSGTIGVPRTIDQVAGVTLGGERAQGQCGPDLLRFIGGRPWGNSVWDFIFRVRSDQTSTLMTTGT